jgi:hypothetical protein
MVSSEETVRFSTRAVWIARAEGGVAVSSGFLLLQPARHSHAVIKSKELVLFTVESPSQWQTTGKCHSVEKN